MPDILVEHDNEQLVVQQTQLDVLVTTVEVTVIDSSGDVVQEKVEVTDILETSRQGPSGPQGIPGLAGDSDTVELNAGETVGGHRVVQMSGIGTAQYADRTVLAHAGRVLGITEHAAEAGEPVRIRKEGHLEFNGWTWIANRHVFLTTSGLMTQTQPTSGLVQVVGVATSPTTMLVRIHEPNILT
jgi:hypothetical protein